MFDVLPKIYKVVHGTSGDMEDFEKQVSQALLQGYVPSGDLITQITDKEGAQEIQLFQPLIIALDENEGEFELEEDEDDDLEGEDDIESDLENDYDETGKVPH